MYFSNAQSSIYQKIKGLFSTTDYSQFRSFFWRRKQAVKVAQYLRNEVDEIMKAAHDCNETAGYRGYVLDTEKQEVVLKTPLYFAEDPCALFVSEYVVAISPEYVNPKSLLIVVEPVKFGEAEKSDADIIDDATLDLPRSNVLKGLQVTAMVDILDILHSHGVYEATYENAGEEQDIDQ